MNIKFDYKKSTESIEEINTNEYDVFFDYDNKRYFIRYAIEIDKAKNACEMLNSFFAHAMSFDKIKYIVSFVDCLTMNKENMFAISKMLSKE